MEKFFGIDIGGTNVKFGIVTTDGKMLEKTKIATADMREGNFVDNFANALKDQLDSNKDIRKVGIGVPGTLSKDRTTTLELPNLPDLNGIPFIPKLREKFPDHIFHIENDANAAALGEYYFSKEKVPESYIFVTLGTGVGGGAIIDGAIFKGGDGNGMEIGHVVSNNGKTLEHNIGKKGILGMALTTLEGYESHSILSDMGQLSSKKVVKAAHESDELALEIFEDVGKYLGEALVSTIRLLDVKTVIIGGGVSETFEYVKSELMNTLQKFLTPYYLDKLDIRLATLGNNAGIIGAASLCFIDD